MEPKFKVGDLIICLYNKGVGKDLTIDKIYKIQAVWEHTVVITNDHNLKDGYYKDRFTLVDKKTLIYFGY